jgi:hypothetical protein
MSQNPDSNDSFSGDRQLADEDVRALCAPLQLHVPEPESEVQIMRLRLVSHPETDPKVLHHIASHGCKQLASRVAEHPGAAPDTLNQLAQHDQHEVRAAVAENQNIPLDLQWLLAEDEHPDVRFALAQSYHIDQSVLASLLEDDNPFVAYRAKTTLQRKNAAMTRATRLPGSSGGSGITRRKLASS